MNNQNYPVVPGEVINQYQEPYQGEPQQPTPLQDQVYQEERVANFISQTSPTTSLDKINYILKGYFYDSVLKQWKKTSKGIPDLIREDIIQFITPILSEDTRMTNLDKDQINGIMVTVIKFLTHYLYNVPKEYTLVEINKIYWLVLEAVFITVMRSQNGIERRELYRSLSLKNSLDQMPVPQSNTEWWKFWK